MRALLARRRFEALAVVVLLVAPGLGALAAGSPSTPTEEPALTSDDHPDTYVPDAPGHARYLLVVDDPDAVAPDADGSDTGPRGAEDPPVVAVRDAVAVVDERAVADLLDDEELSPTDRIILDELDRRDRLGMLFPDLVRSDAGRDDDAGGATPDHLAPRSGDAAGAPATGIAGAARRLAALPGVSLAQQVDPSRIAVETSLSPEELAAIPGVRDVVADDAVVHAFSADEGYPQQWALENAGGSDPWGFPAVADVDLDWEDATARATGDGVVVAVVDTGIDLDHPDLASRAWRNTAETGCHDGDDDDGNGYVDDCGGWDFVHADPTPEAGPDSHGTHVAGIIAAASGNGVGIAGIAPRARIMPLKALEGGSGAASAAAAAIRYAVDNGATIVNASIGAPGAYEGTAMQSALRHATANGVLVVAAAGNDGIDIDVTPVWPAASPEPSVLTVGAHTADDAVAAFSNRGATAVDVFAPGRAILSTMPGGSVGLKQGTSMAAPQVAGIAALVAELEPDHDAAALKSAIMSSVVPAAQYASSVTSGRVDAGLATAGHDRVIGDAVRAEVEGVPGWTADQPQTVAVRTRLTDPLLLGEASRAGVRLTLGVLHAGQVLGVVDRAVTVDGVARTFDGSAQVVLGDGPMLSADDAAQLTSTDGLASELTLTLPAGAYALLVEVVDPTTVAQAPVGNGAAVLFTVTPPGVTDDDPSAPGTADPPPSTGGGAVGTPGAAPGGSTGDLPDVVPPAAQAPGGDVGGPGAPPSTAPGGDDPTATAPAPDAVTGPPAADMPQAPAPADGAAPLPGGDAAQPAGPGDAPASPVTGPGSPDDAPPPQPAGGASPTDVEGDAAEVSPRTGPTAGGTLLKITRSGLPTITSVRVGSQAVAVHHQAAGYVQVHTPPAAAGLASVTLVSEGVPVVVYTDVFLYVGADPRTIGAPFALADGLRVDHLVAGHPLRSLTAADWQSRSCVTPRCAAIAV